MRPKFIAGVAFAASLGCGAALTQVIGNQAPPAASFGISGQTNLLLMPPPLGSSTLNTNLNSAWGSSALSSDRHLRSLPKPGVYKTEPFTCIVIVPGKNADDRSLFKPAEPGSAMPVVRPELRFVPIPAK